MVSSIIGDIYLLLQQARINILARKLRSCLAMLGVWIGSASVVALLYCSQLATISVVSKLSELGTNLISVSLLGSSNYSKDITVASLNEISKKYKHIKKYAPLAFSYESVYFNGKKVNANIIGSNEDFYDISKLELQAGRFISEFDQDEFCVVGVDVQRQVAISLIGSQLKYGKHFCTVVGVLQPAKNNFFIPVDIDNIVLLPIKVFQKSNHNSIIRDVVFSLTSSDYVAEIEKNLKTSLAAISPKTRTYFRNPKELIEKVVEQKQQLTILLAIIGCISLLVGGIGIMNIMLVSVVERKREIGIRLAVGAHVDDIRKMFLVEAILLSLCGGILGVLSGVALSLVIANFASWPIQLLLTPIILGFGVSIFVGVFFGYWPAHTAARLTPVESLRVE
ncbi:MAG: FtsX-like permease family protein [Legionellales bacterium]|jgi:putative ABC transport system permease protein|nr:FtsX-like permease family protein [Legionellales bacterium]